VVIVYEIREYDLWGISHMNYSCTLHRFIALHGR
jgi:hypothetical protein